MLVKSVISAMRFVIGVLTTHTALIARTISFCLRTTHAALIVHLIIHVLAINVNHVYKTHVYVVLLIWRSVTNANAVCTCIIINAYQHVHMVITLMINLNSVYHVMTRASSALQHHASCVNAITTNTVVYVYRRVPMDFTKTAMKPNDNALHVIAHVEHVTRVQTQRALNVMKITS